MGKRTVDDLFTSHRQSCHEKGTGREEAHFKTILKQAEEKGVKHVTPQVKRAGPEGQPFFCLAADAELTDDGLVTGLFDLLEIIKKRTTL
jgi:hypothetical protein